MAGPKYQLYNIRGFHVPLFFSFSYITTFVSNGNSISVCADIFIFMNANQNKVSVNVACSNSLSRKCIGNELPTLKLDKMKYLLNVCMYISAALHLCNPGGDI